MRGTIESLGRGSYLGRIRGDDGHSYPFENNDILAFDLKRLRNGLVVNFETRQNRAVHVSVEPFRLTPIEKEEDNPLRLLGFEQRGTVRVYRFEHVSVGQGRRSYAVSVDLAILKKYRVSIQDGPAICLRLLSAEPDANGAERVVTEPEIQQFAASKVVPPRRTFAPRRRPTPQPQRVILQARSVRA
jgi:hypothetical protein